MNKNLIALLCVAFLTGCNDDASVSSTVNVGGSSESKHSVSETGLFLPGGAGIDFGVKPVTDKVQEESPGKSFRYVIYTIPGSVDEIDGSLKEILTADGYTAQYLSPVPKIYKQWVTYSKPEGVSILVRYQETIKEGFSKNTTIVFKWAE